MCSIQNHGKTCILELLTVKHAITADDITSNLEIGQSVKQYYITRFANLVLVGKFNLENKCGLLFWNAG